MADDAHIELVRRIEAIRDRWHRLVTEIGPERMELPGAMGDWTFKDVASHVTAWRRRGIARLEAARRGEEPPAPPWAADLPGEDEDDPINAWIYVRTKDDPLPHVLAATDQAFDAQLAAIRALPDDAAARELAGYVETEAEDGQPYGHVGTHEVDVRRWLAELD